MEEHRRRYYSIGEAAEILGLKPHILRYWETEFPILRPRKNRAGNRAYTERDIKIVRVIRGLLYDEKYTIEGARQHMKTNRDLVDEQLSLPLDMGTGAEKKPPVDQSALRNIHQEIGEIITMVENI